MATPITDGFRDIFLAGVGALSLTGEKAKDVLDDLIARGQVSVEQGRQINEELRHRTGQAASKVRDDTLRAYVRSMSPEDREQFAELVANMVAEVEAEPEEEHEVEVEVVIDDDDADAPGDAAEDAVAPEDAE